MLNISNNKVSKDIDLTKLKSGKHIFTTNYHKRFRKFLAVSSIFAFVILFLPWTQNISSNGKVTTIQPKHRPQTLQSPIPGKIEEWFIMEGSLVKKGDTILRISEVKSDYFDKDLTLRTQEQLTAKESSVIAYNSKVIALKNQLEALNKERDFKIQQFKNKYQQAKLKVKIDSVDLEAAKVALVIADKQYERVYSLQVEGLKSVRDVEDKKNKRQEVFAKKLSQENKLEVSKASLANSKIEITTIQTSYIDKISKSESDLYSAETAALETQVSVSKLKNTLENYIQRKKLLYLTAPQDGFVNKALKGGIGETFKEGEMLLNIMPSNYQLAVEMFVRPLDLPLIHIGERVRIQFDGWPAIVFSGWPNVSYGTYGANVIAIENFISDNGKYRVLLAPDKEDHKWPNAVRVGSGAKTIALLENVPIWYELWRQINSFPPNFYQPEESKTKN
jgi:membrane fusion protein, adhesin transport system